MCTEFHCDNIISIFSSADHQSIEENLINLNTVVRSMYGSMIEFRAEVKNDINSLREDLNAHNDSVSNLSVCLQEHKKQTLAELAQLQTSLNSAQSSLENISYKLNSTHSKLDSLTATTAQLSSDHQQIQDNISGVECLHTKQSLDLHHILQNNLTHQLKKIQEHIKQLSVHICGGTGWRRVVYLDMTKHCTTCPSGWQLTGYSKRTCGRVSTGRGTCDSVSFSVSGGPYSSICGRIRAYQYGENSAFYNYHIGDVTTIDGAYVSGVSVTHGTPRNHIWTFAAGATENDDGKSDLCPCDTNQNISVPLFVGEDYFCESGVNEPWNGNKHARTFHSNDTLWDGEDCLPSSTCCCSLHNLPYFVKQLSTSTTDDIEARICEWEPLHSTNTAVELVELYVQ